MILHRCTRCHVELTGRRTRWCAACQRTRHNWHRAHADRPRMLTKTPKPPWPTCRTCQTEMVGAWRTRAHCDGCRDTADRERQAAYVARRAEAACGRFLGRPAGFDFDAAEIERRYQAALRAIKARRADPIDPQAAVEAAWAQRGHAPTVSSLMEGWE